MRVEALIAVCDLVPPEEYTASPGGASFKVMELAELSDGSRITLLDDRGWTSWPRGLSLDDYWNRLTVQDVEQDVLNVVLPDNAEDTGEEHEWEWFVSRLADAGVETTVEALKQVPYRIELADRLRRRLG